MKTRYRPSSRLLNVGCGDHYHPEWCNVEIASRDPAVILHDIRRGLPFEDGYFDAVYHSHVLEHLTARDGEHFLYECLRVLRPGGILRIVVPDLEIIAALYLEKLRRVNEHRQDTVADYCWMKLELLDQMVREQSGGLMGKYMTDPKIINSDFVRTRLGNEFSRLQPGQDLSAIGAVPANRWSLSAWMYDRFSLGQLCRRLGFVHFKICGPESSRIPDFKRYQLDTSGTNVRKPDSLFIECLRPPLAAQNAA
jgi:predicted SAM-dependent methyltransferase